MLSPMPNGGKLAVRILGCCARVSGAPISTAAVRLSLFAGMLVFSACTPAPSSNGTRVAEQLPSKPAGSEVASIASTANPSGAPMLYSPGGEWRLVNFSGSTALFATRQQTGDILEATIAKLDDSEDGSAGRVLSKRYQCEDHTYEVFAMHTVAATGRTLSTSTPGQPIKLGVGGGGSEAIDRNFYEFACHGEKFIDAPSGTLKSLIAHFRALPSGRTP